MSGVHKMKVNFYTTDGSAVEDRAHEEENDSLTGLRHLIEETYEMPNLTNDILSVEFDLHIKSRQDVVEAITLLNSSMPLFDD